MNWLQLASNRAVQLVLVLGLGLGAGALLHKHLNPVTTVHILDPHTTIVTVEKPVLSEKVVTQIITDPKEKALVAQLIKENDGLRNRIIGLTSTTAVVTTTGGTGVGGAVTPVLPNPSVVGGQIQTVPSGYKFHDYQLDASYNGSIFNYQLHQQFNIVSISGLDKDGNKVGMVRMYQTGPTGAPVLVPTTSTFVFANESTPRFIISPRIQGGFGVSQDGTKQGIVALQWLKHGKSTAAEDVRWAVLSPAGLVQGHSVALGLLPVSFNVGTIPHNPFTNLWVSPSVQKTGQTYKVGVVLSATF